MIKRILKFFLNPYPIRSLAISLIRKLELGTFEQRARISALKQKSEYGYCLYHGAMLAKKLGYSSVSAIEFGVAGGNGLIALEKHAIEIEKLLKIDIKVFGFDLGESGLLEPEDYRDCPFFWKKGFYQMDVESLKNKLIKAELVIGNIKNTLNRFMEERNAPPLAAAMFDLDYYSATRDAFEFFNYDEKYYLPRVFCYFDDLLGTELIPLNDFIGQPLAISEFNRNNENKKIVQPKHLVAQPVVEGWYHKIAVFHDFKHSKYNAFVGKENQQNILY